MKDIILKEAAEQIRRYGLRKFTMDGIAEELKMSKKTLYKYFPGKDAIIHEYFKEVVESDWISTEASLIESDSISNQMNAVVFSYHKYRLPVSILDEAYKFYPEEWAMVQQLKEKKIKLIKDCLQKAMNEGELKQDLNLNVLGTMLDSITDSLLNYDILSENQISLKDAISEVMKVILYGIIK